MYINVVDKLPLHIIITLWIYNNELGFDTCLHQHTKSALKAYGNPLRIN